MESMARGHWDEWMWTARNGVAVLAALVLAGILSQARVFQEAVLGSDGFNAAAVVRLLGHGIALALIWMTAWRAAAQIPPRDTVSCLLHEGLAPFATLLILPGVYGLIRPFLSERAVTGVSWMFVLLLLATAVWLGRVLYANAEARVIGAGAIRRRVSESAERRTRACQNCEAPNSATAKFCTSCGKPLEQPASRDDKLTVVSENERSSTDLRRSA
jgi:uncharacterized paraquat-inducible protein A